MDFSTLAIHMDGMSEPDCYDIAPPLHVSSTFEYDNPENLVYSRADNMTRRRVEIVLGGLDKGYALTYSSGLASVSSLLQHLKPKKVYMNFREGYFGSYDVLCKFKRTVEHYSGQQNTIQIELLSALDSIDVSNIQLPKHEYKETPQSMHELYQEHIIHEEEFLNFKPEKDTLIWVETPLNPTSYLRDMEHYAKVAQKIGAYLVVDSTFATPVLQIPLEWGADFTMHSVTKFLNGHSDIVGGATVCKNKTHFHIMRKERSIEGNVLGNMECWLLLRSLRSVHVRVKQQAATAVELAQWLHSQISSDETFQFISKVHHPSLPDNPEQQRLWKTQLHSVGPAMISVELNSMENALKICKLFRLFKYATSLGGVESLVDWRYRWDHNQPKSLLRLSIGLENAKDLIEDWKQALHALHAQ